MTTPKRPDKSPVKFEQKSVDTFERKGGYPSARVPRSEMKPPPSSTIKTKPASTEGSTPTSN